jgi:hypothetical protein
MPRRLYTLVPPSASSIDLAAPPLDGQSIIYGLDIRYFCKVLIGT